MRKLRPGEIDVFKSKQYCCQFYQLSCLFWETLYILPPKKTLISRKGIFIFGAYVVYKISLVFIVISGIWILILFFWQCLLKGFPFFDPILKLSHVKHRLRNQLNYSVAMGLAVLNHLTGFLCEYENGILNSILVPVFNIFLRSVWLLASHGIFNYEVFPYQVNPKQTKHVVKHIQTSF